jgi:large subunit ribosomal protein L17
MKHKIGYNPLERKPSHRKALHKNMVTSLLRYEKITTTKTKAQAIRRTAERMITRAKNDSVHNRREIAKSIGDKAILAKLFTEIGPRFKERNGGYTRIVKLGFRQNDAAEMVILELVGEEEEPQKKKKDKKKKVSAKKTGAEEPKIAKEKKAPVETEPETATEDTQKEAEVTKSGEENESSDTHDSVAFDEQTPSTETENEEGLKEDG